MLSSTHATVPASTDSTSTSAPPMKDKKSRSRSNKKPQSTVTATDATPATDNATEQQQQQQQQQDEDEEEEQQQQSLTKQMSNVSVIESEDPKENAFLAIVQKRLRTLKKRLAKIERYESDRANNDVILNADQLTAVDKKQEVLALVRELEDAHTQMQETVTQEMKADKKATRQAKAEQQRREDTVREEMQTRFDAQIECASRFFYACNAILPTVPTTFVSAADRDVLLHLQSTLTGVGLDESIEPVAMAKHAELLFKKLMNSTDDIAVGSLTFARVSEIVEKAFAFLQEPPVPEPQFMVENAQVVAEEKSVPQQEQVQQQQEHQYVAEIVAPQLSFMTMSSVIVDEVPQTAPVQWDHQPVSQVSWTMDASSQQANTWTGGQSTSAAASVGWSSMEPSSQSPWTNGNQQQPVSSWSTPAHTHAEDDVVVETAVEKHPNVASSKEDNRRQRSGSQGRRGSRGSSSILARGSGRPFNSRGGPSGGRGGRRGKPKDAGAPSAPSKE